MPPRPAPSDAVPCARDEPPWSCNGDSRAPDFGTLYAFPAYAGWSLYYDRRQHRFAFSTAEPLGDEVVHAARRWTVVRLTAADERALRRAEAAMADQWNGRTLAEARLQAARTLEQLAAEQLDAFEQGAILGAIDQAVASVVQARDAGVHAGDLDAQLYGEALDRLTELRVLMRRLAEAHAPLCAERDRAKAQQALADLEDDLSGERAV